MISNTISNKVPERGWIPLYAVSSLGKIATATKLQKLIFLIVTEGKIEGYRFFKNNHGPYSAELDVDVRAFSGPMNLMKTKTVEGARYPYTLYESTQKGTAFIHELKSKLPKKTLNSIDAIIKEYGSKTYQELIEYVYTKYVIPQQKFDRLYSDLKDDILSLKNIWEEQYEDDCPASFLILAIIEYEEKALTKLKVKSDSVLRGVCTTCISELTEKLVTLTSNCRTSEKCPFSFKTLLSEVSDQIGFLDHYCSKHGIMETIMEIDFGDFMNEEELERLEKTFKEINPSELMY